MDTRRLFIEFAKEINDCQGWSINSDAQYLAVMAALEASAAEIAALKAALERNELSMDKELALKYAELQAQNNTLRQQNFKVNIEAQTILDHCKTLEAELEAYRNREPVAEVNVLRGDTYTKWYIGKHHNNPVPDGIHKLFTDPNAGLGTDNGE